MVEWEKEKPDLKDTFPNNKPKGIVFSIPPSISLGALSMASEHPQTK